MWSLAVEVSFYLVLPVLMLIGAGPGLKVRRLLLLLAAMLAVSVAWTLGLAGRVDEVSPGLPLSWLPGYLSWFAVGIALALAHVHAERAPDAPWVRRVRLLGSTPGACWTAAAGLLLLAATPLAGPSVLFVATPAEALFKQLDYALLAGLVVLTGVFTVPGSRYLRWMSLPLARHLGHISYSVFCIHLAVLHGVMTWGDFELFRGPGLTIWLLTVCCSLVAAELLYRLVERPAMRLKSRANGPVPVSDQPNDTMQAATTK
jgi:peptidoglycan/LPS O-acetylase OafA/YrhL